MDSDTFINVCYWMRWAICFYKYFIFISLVSLVIFNWTIQRLINVHYYHLLAPSWHILFICSLNNRSIVLNLWQWRYIMAILAYFADGAQPQMYADCISFCFSLLLVLWHQLFLALALLVCCLLFTFLLLSSSAIC